MQYICMYRHIHIYIYIQTYLHIVLVHNTSAKIVQKKCAYKFSLRNYGSWSLLPNNNLAVAFCSLIHHTPLSS